MKWGAVVVVVALAVAAVVVPTPEGRPPDALEELRPAPYAVCPAGDGARRTSTVVVSGSAGDVGLNVFSAGETIATSDLTIPETGGLTTTINEMTAVAQAPVLVTLPDAQTLAGLVLSGAGEAVAACDAGAGDVVVLPGGSTNADDTFVIVVANPFAGSAVVDIGAASEVGSESNSALNGIVVPPRAAVSVDLGAVLPGRLGMSAWVTPTEGRVVVSGLQEGPGDVAAVQGLSPGMDWYLPIAALNGISTDLVVANPSGAEVAFQLDVYGDDEILEAFYEDVVPPRGHLSIPTSDFLEGAGSVRVLAAAPVATALRLVGEVGRAIVPGVTAPSADWQLPGAGVLGASQVLVLNPSDFDASVEITDVGGTILATVDVPAGKTMAVPTDPTEVGATLRADAEVVATWVTRTENGISGDAARLPPS